MQRKELNRQVFHMLFGILLIILLYYEIIGIKHVFYLLLLGSFLFVLSLRYDVPIIYWFLKKFGRENELKKFPGRGAFFFILGTLLVLKLFSKDVALASIAVLTLGDSISHIIGGNIKGKYLINNLKNIEGVFIGSLLAFFGAHLFVPFTHAFFGSFVAMFTEYIGLKMHNVDIDDNLIVPLVAGTIMHLFETHFAVFF